MNDSQGSPLASLSPLSTHTESHGHKLVIHIVADINMARQKQNKKQFINMIFDLCHYRKYEIISALLSGLTSQIECLCYGAYQQ